MLSTDLQRYAERMVKGELPSLADEDIICWLYGLLARDGEERRVARLLLRETLNLHAPVASRPISVVYR